MLTDTASSRLRDDMAGGALPKPFLVDGTAVITKVTPKDHEGADALAGSGDGTELIEISSLRPGPSLRLDGRDEEHVRALAVEGLSLPPIVVQRSTLRVIDGAHRVRAASLRGESCIRARYFDGSDSDAYIAAVRLNARHGKPLSLKEREAAASSILASRPQLSDRAVAAICSLSPATAAALRRRGPDGGGQSETRIGQDGRTRPVDPSAARAKVVQVLRENPSESDRSVARTVGVSAATVHAVRSRLAKGLDPVISPRDGGMRPNGIVLSGVDEKTRPRMPLCDDRAFDSAPVV
jgi:hypothetical protein